MLGVDTGVWKEVSSGRALGVGAKSEVVVRSRARVHWGGEGMGGVFTPGMSKSLGGVKGGCCALVHEGCSPKIMARHHLNIQLSESEDIDRVRGAFATRRNNPVLPGFRVIFAWRPAE